MAANVDIEKQFLRLIMFCHKISLPVVRTFFVSGVLGCPDYNNDISTFLEHHKHEIFHLVGDYKCCQCTNLPSLQLSSLKFRLGNDQFKKLYEIGLSQPGHFMKGSRGRVFQQCLCCVTVRKETDPKTYDISLLFAILYNCVELSDNRRLWLDTIRKGRNRLCHLNDINDLSENELQTLWGNLECSVVRLAEEIHSLPYYKECIEQHVDTFKYTDYNREAIIPIIESMRSEINNNINEVIQNQMISQEEVRCLTIHVEQLSQNCKRDNKNMFNHVSESAKTIVDLHQDAVHQMSAQVAKCHIEEVELIKDQNKAVIESSKKVSGTMEHVIEKLNFLVDIAIDNTKYQHTENNSTLPKGGQSNKRSTTQEQKYSEEQEIKRCKLHWRIETPEYLEHKKDDIVKAMKNAIEIVKIGTSHEIEDINEGSITIDTLLPISILQDEKAFHHSIRKFLDAMVSICRIDTSIPLEVKVQITFIDQEQGSVRYSIDEINHTTTINRAVQAVPTMMDKSTTAMESPINETTDNPNCIEKAVGVLMVYSMKIKDNALLPTSKLPFFRTNDDDSKGITITNLDHTNMVLLGCFDDVEWVESILTVCESLTPICQIQNTKMTKKLLNQVKHIVYIASMSSQESYNLKPLLECLSESKLLPKKIVTIKRDHIMLPDVLKKSKQINISVVEKEWVSNVMDAIAMTGSTLYSLTLFMKKNSTRIRNFNLMHGQPYCDETYGTFFILGSFKHVSFINSILSKYESKLTSFRDFEIRVQPNSWISLNTDSMKGIICVPSEDFQLEYLFHPVIKHMKLWPTNVLTVLINQMDLPKILKGTKPIDATRNNEDWVPEFIDAVQTMPSKAYVLRYRDEHYIRRQRYIQNVKGNEIIDKGLILVMGSTRAIQRFDNVLSKNDQTPMMQLVQVPFKQLRSSTIKSMICVIANSNEDLSLHPNMKQFACWPNNVITVVMENMTVPDLLKETTHIFETGNEANWLTDVMDAINRSNVTVIIENYQICRLQCSHVVLDKNGNDCVTLTNTTKNCNDVETKCDAKTNTSTFDVFMSNFDLSNEHLFDVKRDQIIRRIAVFLSGYFWDNTVSIVNILRFSCGELHDVNHEDVLLMGNTLDVQWFYSALYRLKNAVHSEIKLTQISLEKLCRKTVKSIICVVQESSKEEDFFLYQNIKDFECWPKNVITIVRDEMTVPNLFEGTNRIDATGRQEKWLSKVMDAINKASKSFVCLKNISNNDDGR
ncbi:unnamed protein product [Mytilus coruscus]|uniref:DZIP3-like HEPN domain-containing protein n=1 Tax=Mytilus coruscus TaxID=42192 RepID=A0A6J8AF01_MYTCO|nr:unnamed protein product [Mytilus coruscus]